MDLGELALLQESKGGVLVFGGVMNRDGRKL